jgi:hypothetical protein
MYMRKCSPLGYCPLDVSHKVELRKLSCLLSSLYSITLSQIFRWCQSGSIGPFLNLTHTIFLLSVIYNIISTQLYFTIYPSCFFLFLMGNIIAFSCILVTLPMKFSLLIPCFIVKDFVISIL